MILPWVYFLKADEQLVIERFTQRFTLQGPRLYFSRPWERVRREKGTLVGPTEYLRIRNRLTGEVKNLVGSQLVFPTADEKIESRLEKLVLGQQEYVKILDQQSGSLRVEQGEQSIVLAPTEVLLGEIQRGLPIDEKHAVLIRNTQSGELQLITEPQVYIPTPYEQILETREKLNLEDHECLIVKNLLGEYKIKRGSDQERSFFLGPYEELLTLHWSCGLLKDSRMLHITHLDLRPKFMWYQFEVRTRDNVELIVDITFFWQISQVEKMLQHTDDAPGDVCAHTRSMIIQAISKVDLEGFLDQFNPIIHAAVLEGDQTFFAERGLKLHRVEVRSIACKDTQTQQILQDIIQETTHRLNQLQKQESKNEVLLKELEGEFSLESQREKLLALKQQHLKTEATMAGEAEALRVKTFFQGLGEQLSNEAKMQIYQTLRKNEALSTLSQSKAQLYFTPSDIDLRIESHNK